MTAFFVSLALIVAGCGGYLAFLWFRPDKRSRFRVRLTLLFLLVSILPAVPLLFAVSFLTTNTANLLLLPQVEVSLMHALDALKLQFEQRARRFAIVWSRGNGALADLQSWQVDYCLEWQRDGDQPALTNATASSESLRVVAAEFGASRMQEVWGQTGSELLGVIDPLNNTVHCRVWLPAANGRMLLVGFPVVQPIAQAKEELLHTLRIYNSLAMIKESALRNQLIWLSAAGVILLLALTAIGVARSLARRLSEPIEGLTQVMGHVAAGDLHHQVDLKAKDEIGFLITSFNQMISDLRLSQEKLIASERLAAWREVARQVSHEIKNPLTPIQLALYRIKQRLSSGLSDHQAVQQSFRSLEQALSSLQRLANEFSEFARLPAAKLVEDDLNEVIVSTAKLYDSPEGRARLVLALAPDLPRRPLDREQFGRLLVNLIKNAVEASDKPASRITITTERLAERARLIVADDGPGLSPEAAAKLFHPNFTTKAGGSGLGLTIVKRIVEEHGGDISVASERGKGTRINVVI